MVGDSTKDGDDAATTGETVVSLADWRRTHEPELRRFRPARVMSVGGGATDRFTNEPDLGELATSLAPILFSDALLGSFVIDGRGQLVACGAPVEIVPSPFAATAEFVSALEGGRTARFDGERVSWECRVLADALVVCRILAPGSSSSLDAVVARAEPRIAALVAGLRAVHPSVLPAIDLQGLFDD